MRRWRCRTSFWTCTLLQMARRLVQRLRAHPAGERMLRMLDSFGETCLGFCRPESSNGRFTTSGMTLYMSSELTAVHKRNAIADSKCRRLRLGSVAGGMIMELCASFRCRAHHKPNTTIKTEKQ
mmetsp:Transcript_64118/g.171672  ORF Transcript_64118/g.171672 Transcript_64118/m.171672 type:complete len:124 (-) Transcript_64118:26-397(-)